jgi:hypothetical protein
VALEVVRDSINQVQADRAFPFQDLGDPSVGFPHAFREVALALAPFPETRQDVFA